MKENLIIENQIFKNLKGIIFDLGAVIVEINYNKTIEAFKAIGISNIESLFSQHKQIDVFDLFEKGLISGEVFRRQLLQFVSNENISNKEFDAAWNAMIIDLPIENLFILEKLKQTYPTYLLSNTNEIHIRYLNEFLRMKYNVDNFSYYFEKVYYSYEMKMRKPDIEIFKYVINQIQYDPEQILFIDDNKANIESAKATGLQTYLMPPGKLIKDIIRFV